MKNEKMKVQYRVNEQIHAREVRIVGDDTETQVMPTAKALQLAERKGLDLVEISPNAVKSHRFTLTSGGKLFAHRFPRKGDSLFALIFINHQRRIEVQYVAERSQ